MRREVRSHLKEEKSAGAVVVHDATRQAMWQECASYKAWASEVTSSRPPPRLASQLTRSSLFIWLLKSFCEDQIERCTRIAAMPVIWPNHQGHSKFLKFTGKKVLSCADHVMLLPILSLTGGMDLCWFVPAWPPAGQPRGMFANLMLVLHNGK